MLKMWFGEALFIWRNIFTKMFFGFLLTDICLSPPVCTHGFPLWCLFNRPAHWMGRRIHFWRRTLLYQVSYHPPSSHAHRGPPWHQNLLTSLNLNSFCNIRNFARLYYNKISVDFWNSYHKFMKSSLKCSFNMYARIIMEPLLAGSVLQKSTIKVNDYSGILSK